MYDMVLQSLGWGSRGLLTFDLYSVADLFPGLRVTVFYFLGSEYNESLFQRQCGENWLIETHFGQQND